MKFLAIVALAMVLGRSPVKAETLICLGTEPFWRSQINLEKGWLKLEIPEDKGMGIYQLDVKSQTSPNDLSVRHFHGMVNGAITEGWLIDTTNTRASCNDGMSDTDYQYEYLLQLNGRVLSGCCQPAGH